MICDEDPLRRRPRESTARRKRQERCVWMARKMTEWPSKRGPITKIMPSDGCIGDTVPLAVGKWYDFHEFGWYMGNVGLSLFMMFSHNTISRFNGIRASHRLRVGTVEAVSRGHCAASSRSIPDHSEGRRKPVEARNYASLGPDNYWAVSGSRDFSRGPR